MKQSNKKLYPEAWSFYVEQARNITNEPELVELGNYRIPEPNKSGNFIYANTIEELWTKFMFQWYKPNLNSESVHGKIQYIVQNFNR